MEQLEKLTAEQKKIYECLMVYDSVMTSWIDAEEENRVKFRNNPLKAFLCATGMGKEEFQAMMSPLGDGKALQTYMEDGNDFELEEAKTSYTNGWDIVNLTTVDMVDLVLKKIFGDGFWKSYSFKQEKKSTDITLQTHIATMEITALNGTLATIKMMMEECTVSGMLEGTVVATSVGEIKAGFQVELQQVSLETESGTTLDLYLDVKAKDAIKNPSVEVQTDNFFIKCILEEVLREGLKNIINSLPIDEPYKICSVEMDEGKLQKAGWIIPDHVSFSGSSVGLKDGGSKDEVAVFLKTLDKDINNLNLNIEQQFADSDADGTLGIAERLILGHILPLILTQVNDGTASAEYDADENCLKIDRVVSISQYGADVKIKDFKVSSRENGFRLAFYLDGDWGAGMVKFHGTGYCDMKLEFVKDGKGESQLLASVSDPKLDYGIDIPWWEYLIIACLAPFFIWVSDALLIILSVAVGVIKSIFSDIQENGIDGLPVDVALPVKWNDMEFVDIKSMHFSKGLHISYSMKVAGESVEQ